MKWSNLNNPWKLMSDHCISGKDRASLAEFLIGEDRLTQGKLVKEFEQEWSKWQECKHSVFVNSGSSANLLLVHAVQSLYKKRPKKWAAQACTWCTTLSPIIQSSPYLYLSDIDLKNFAPDLKELDRIFKEQDIQYLFLTHLLGFPAVSDELLELCERRNVILLEDCCEAHGATFKGKKVGNFGIGSTFSFYYGHHMTTVEGGMICTNNDELYHELLLLRSHGLLRELPSDERAKRQPEGVDPKFCFLRDGFNCRNTELHALLGLTQVPKLDKYIEIRNRNFNVFINALDSSKYQTEFALDGISSFALPIFVKDPSKMDAVTKTLNEHQIESRPCIAGNIYRHPLAKALRTKYPDDNAEKIHAQCMYVGNHQHVEEEDVRKLCEILNDV